MPDLTPNAPLLAAYAVFEGHFHAMFERDTSLNRAIKFLGRAEAGGAASPELASWHETSFAVLEERTVDEDHAVVPTVAGGTPGEPEELAPAPWYVVFEVNPAGEAVGDLWVGRFFQQSLGPRTLMERGVYFIEAKPDVRVFDNEPVLIGSLADRSVIFAQRNATGAASAEGDHGGTATGAVRRDW